MITKVYILKDKKVLHSEGKISVCEFKNEKAEAEWIKEISKTKIIKEVKGGDVE